MVNSILGLVLGHSLVAMPLVLIIVLSALKNYDMNQEKVAVHSASQQGLLLRSPYHKSNFRSPGLISFLTSFDEIIISLFVAGGDNSTITRSMFWRFVTKLIQRLAISTILIIISSGLLILSNKW